VETFRRETLYAPGRQKLSRPDAAVGEREGPARRPRFARATIGFWLGGGLLGAAGCALGVYVPYHDPVAVVISALWWGIYLGCLGGSVGALIAWFSERPSAPSRRGADGGSLPPAPATKPAACSVPQEERFVDLPTLPPPPPATAIIVAARRCP
jgi:hypothetical protein